jgi:hypothetical protein
MKYISLAKGALLQLDASSPPTHCVRMPRFLFWVMLIFRTICEALSGQPGF